MNLALWFGMAFLFISGCAFDSRTHREDFNTRFKAEMEKREECKNEYKEGIKKFIGKKVWFNRSMHRSCIFYPGKNEYKFVPGKDYPATLQAVEAHEKELRKDQPTNFEELTIVDSKVEKCGTGQFIDYWFTLKAGERFWTVQSSSPIYPEMEFEKILYGGDTGGQAVNCLLPFEPRKKFKLTKEMWRLVKTEMYKIGMPIDAAKLVFGKPDEIDRRHSANGTLEIWSNKYSGRMCFFENGRLTIVRE